VATNLSTSMLVDDVARRHGVEVFRTRIGEANVVQGMVEHGCIGGGEGNGGVIYPPISTVRDGLGALGLIIELMAQRKLPLSKLAAQWPQYAIVKDKVQLGSLDPAMVLQELARMHASESIDTQDGLKIIGTSSWVHIRPSNTEPILRCIAEAPSLEEAQQLARQILDEVQELS
jgi:phosphomannomutase